MQDVQFADTTLGDAQQTLWGACMDDDMLLPYVAHMDEIGFRSIEMMNATVFEQCVRVLEEDPWERMRRCAERAVRNPLGVRTRGQYLFGRRPLADDVVAAGVERLAANGIRRHLCHDPLNSEHVARSWPAARRLDTLFAEGRFGPGHGSLLFKVGIRTPAGFGEELLAWYRQEHLPILLECPEWNGCRFVREEVHEGCQFHALHQLSHRRALESSERSRSRSTPWFFELKRNDWFDEPFSRVLYRRFERSPDGTIGRSA